MQRELQNVHRGSVGSISKPPILPKPPRILKTPSVDKNCDTVTVKVPTPIGKDSDCGTLQSNAGVHLSIRVFIFLELL